MSDWTGNSHSAFVTNGASNHASGERAVSDYYATDPKAVDSLLAVYPLKGRVWECACGEGHLAKKLVERGFEVVSSDLVDRGYGEGGVNFLCELTTRAKNIVTNPPYKYAVDFVEHALRLLPEGGVCAMFLRTLFLEGKGRRERIFDITPPIMCSSFQSALNALKTAYLTEWQVYRVIRGLFGKKDTAVIRL
jgi:hypothetical protein